MRNSKKIALVLSLLTQNIVADIIKPNQSKQVSAAVPHIDIGGYVSFKIHGDARQVDIFGDGILTLYPKPKVYDAFCCDINAQPLTNFLAVQTRLQIDAWLDNLSWCDRASGYIEGDFTGVTDITLQCFRLRHAYALLDWKHLQLLLGQFWDPLFVIDCFPDTIAYNNGAPIEVQSRNPQVRATCRWHNSEMMLVAMSQQFGFNNTGPHGFSPRYIRNAVMPNWHVQYRYLFDTSVVGAFVDLKRLVPRLIDDEGNAVNEHILSWIAGAYSSLKWEHFYISLKTFYAQNATDQTLLGGYAATCQTLIGNRLYTPTQLINAWVDMQYTRDGLGVGGFAGVSKNLGTRKDILKDAFGNFIIYARNPDISYVWRVSPRILYTVGPLRVAAEFEYTTAGYGTIAQRDKVVNVNPVGNLRVILASYYFF